MTIEFAVRLVVSAALSLSSSDLEKQAAHHLGQEFERVGRSAPAIDESLTRAARALAQEAIETSATEAANVYSVSQALSEADGYDPSPRALAIRGSPPAQALASFLARTDAGQEHASRMGIGASIRGDSAALVALLVTRKVNLRPFPRLVKPGASPQLCGQLLAQLHAADVFVTRPNGEVEKVPLALDEDARFCAKIGFPQPGRYSVEVVGRGSQGPEVAALFFADAGSAGRRAGRTRISEPASVPEARSAILARINALRKVHNLSLVELDQNLSSVAQAYSELMASQNFFAHVAPDGSDLRRRLQKVGYGYRVAGENLGLASGPLAAQFCIEQSPGHLRNLIDGRYTRLGIGIAYQKLDGRPQAILTQILAEPAVGSSDPIQDAYRSLQEKRANLKLPALRRSEVLEQIALEHAKRALELDQPKPQLPGVPLQERVFAALKDVRTTSVDVFISESPRLIADSKNLGDQRNDRVGIGAVKGDSATYGRNKYWVVVIYAAPK
jgi:uncharacterized protein YkwD